MCGVVCVWGGGGGRSIPVFILEDGLHTNMTVMGDKFWEEGGGGIHAKMQNSNNIGLYNK